MVLGEYLRNNIESVTDLWKRRSVIQLTVYRRVVLVVCVLREGGYALLGRFGLRIMLDSLGFEGVL